MTPALWLPPNWKGRGQIIERRADIIVLQQRECFGWSTVIFLANAGMLVPVAMQDILATTSASVQTYTSKTSWNNGCNSVETIGGGGAGAIGAGTTSAGGGGGAGAYNRINNFVFATPGTTTASFQVNVGLLHGGSFPGTASDTWFNGATLAGSSVGSKGGLSPLTSTATTGGTAGLASAGVPTTSPPGRNGGAGGNAGAVALSGGAGGGAGGQIAAGTTPGTGPTAGGTGDGTRTAGGVSSSNPGGNGGTGTEFDATHGSGGGGGSSNASPGTGGNGGLYGGGGAGGNRSTGVGGDGAQGVISLSSVFPDFARHGHDASTFINQIMTVGYQ